MKTIFYTVETYGPENKKAYRMQSPFPLKKVSQTYIGYTEKQAQKAFRNYLGMQRKHIEFVKL